MRKISGIYCILNESINLIYIGSTNDLRRRKNQHFSLLDLKKHFNNKLQNAWNKYGKENFSFNIIEECLEHELQLKEQFWINFYQSYKQNQGYNLVKIAERKVLSDETKSKISKNHKRHWKNKKFSKSHLEKMKKNHSGHFRGKKLSPEHVSKLKECHKKKIIQIDSLGNVVNEFLGIEDASKKTGFSAIGIQQVLTKYKRKTIYGFSFNYKS